MGKAGGRWDFEWVYNEQPHTWRRKEILGKIESNHKTPVTTAKCDEESQKLSFWSEMVYLASRFCLCDGTLSVVI